MITLSGFRDDEFGNNYGLGIIKGEIKKFVPNQINLINYPVPQIGWNKIIKKYLDLIN